MTDFRDDDTQLLGGPGVDRHGAIRSTRASAAAAPASFERHAAAHRAIRRDRRPVRADAMTSTTSPALRPRPVGRRRPLAGAAEPSRVRARRVDPRLLRIGAVGLVGVLMIPSPSRCGDDAAMACAPSALADAASPRPSPRPLARRPVDDRGTVPPTAAASPPRRRRRAPAIAGSGPSAPPSPRRAAARRRAGVRRHLHRHRQRLLEPLPEDVGRDRSRSGWPPTTPRPTRRCTSATSCASPPAPPRPTRRRHRRPPDRRPADDDRRRRRRTAADPAAPHHRAAGHDPAAGTATRARHRRRRPPPATTAPRRTPPRPSGPTDPRASRRSSARSGPTTSRSGRSASPSARAGCAPTSTTGAATACSPIYFEMGRNWLARRSASTQPEHLLRRPHQHRRRLPAVPRWPAGSPWSQTDPRLTLADEPRGSDPSPSP